MEDRRAYLAATLATILFLGSLRIFLSSVYFLNLEDLGLNATALYALLLLSPALLLVPWLAAHTRVVLITGAALLGLGAVLATLATRAGTAIALAGIASAAYVFLFHALLRHGGAAPVAMGVATGLAFDAARLLTGMSVDPLAPTWSAVFQALLAAALLAIMATAYALPHEIETRSVGATLAASAGFGAWLFLQTAVFASAHHVARWNEAPLLFTGPAVILGVVLGVLLVLFIARRDVPGRAFLAPNLLVAFLLADHAFFHSPLLPASLLAAQAVLVIDLYLIARILIHAPIRIAGGAMALGMLVYLALVFVFVFTFTFAFVPMGDVWKGAEAGVLIAGVAILLFASYVAIVAHTPGQRGAFRRTPLARGLVASVLLIPLALGGLAGLTPGEPVNTPIGTDLRVLSYNVHQGFNNDGVLDADIFERVLREVDADIVSLQESDTARLISGNMDIVAILAHRLGYETYYGQPTRAQSFGVAILSRFPIEETTLLQLTSDADNRYLVGARIQVEGQNVWFFAIHMGLARENRLAQLDEILAHAEDLGGPRILAGDLNSCPNGHCPDYEGEPDNVYARVTTRYRDTWTEAGFDRDDPAGFTYHAADPDRRIDYILATNHFDVRYAAVLQSAHAIAASDHLPVVADLTLAR